MFKYPSIEQFRHVVKEVLDQAGYHGVRPPTLQFEGTVKLHGTNASIYVPDGGGDIKFYSRSRAITPEDDNFGFAAALVHHADVIRALAKVAANHLRLYSQNPPCTGVTLFGEWCGPGIQKGVGISKIDERRFFIFDALGHSDCGDEWLPKSALLWMEASDILQILPQFKTYTLDIDFSKPEEAVPELLEITKRVEDCCPVSKASGVVGVGEGVVWKCEQPWIIEGRDILKDKRLVFKVKGEKHAETQGEAAKVKADRYVDVRPFVYATVTDARLSKIFIDMRCEGAVSVQDTGSFIKRVQADVLKEEGDTIEANGLLVTQVLKAVASMSANWFKVKLSECPLG